VRLRRLLTSLCAAAFTACSGSSIAGPGDAQEFARAKARWDARSFQDYRFEIRTFCFCPPEMTQWNRVVVRDGVVESATPVDENPVYPLSTTVYFRPIDTLFADLLQAMSQGDIKSPYSKIIVDYDPELGYPRRVEYRSKPTVADAGATIALRNVQAADVPEPAATLRPSRFSRIPYSSGKR
jgi:hypothetical protein